MQPVPNLLGENANMSDLIAGMADETRRRFLREAGAIAGGAVLLGGTRAALGQAERPAVPAQGPEGAKPARIRAMAPAATVLEQLGPLAELAGTWVGHGFNLISLPDFDNPPPAGPQPFRLKLNATTEILELTPIGGNVPNRGSTGQNDINIFGLTYLQRVSDATTNSALHIEPGLWLHVPATDVPMAPDTLVRQGSIPHGTSIMAQGAVIPTVKGGPDIQPADPTPFTDKGKIQSAGYLTPFTAAVIPPGAQSSYVKNPNQALLDAIANQTITQTEVLDISTVTSGAPSFQGGGLLNIPFLDKNAKATQFSATFWIETVKQQDGTTFMQLQYTQTIILDFLDIHWPHISVATLVKQ
jgi:hypothetical protein